MADKLEWKLPKEIKDYSQMFPLYMWDSGFLVDMNIDFAMSYFPSKDYTYSKRSLEILEKRFKEGLEIDPIFLKVNIDNCEVTSHEGRHRLLVAQKLGITGIPTLIEFYSKADDYNLIHDQELGLNNKCCKTEVIANSVSIPCTTKDGCYLKEVKADCKIIPQERKMPLSQEIRELFESEVAKCKSGEESAYGEFFC